MRKVALTVIAALVAGAALAASAEAINSEQKFSASVAPATPGTAAKPSPVALSVRQWFDDISLDPDTFAIKEVRFFFPKEIAFNTQRFPQCSRGEGQRRRRALPRRREIGSRQGRRDARSASPRTCGSRSTTGPAATASRCASSGRSPLEIDGVIEGKLTRQTVDPRYGQVLTVTIPAGVHAQDLRHLRDADRPQRQDPRPHPEGRQAQAPVRGPDRVCPGVADVRLLSRLHRRHDAHGRGRAAVQRHVRTPPATP